MISTNFVLVPTVIQRAFVAEQGRKQSERYSLILLDDANEVERGVDKPLT